MPRQVVAHQAANGRKAAERANQKKRKDLQPARQRKILRPFGLPYQLDR